MTTYDLDGMSNALIESHLKLPERKSGKVREWYRLPKDNARLMVTTDRLSAFDRVLAGVCYKGQVLNQLSAWWFKNTEDIVKNHVIAVPDPNVLVAKEVTPLPIEVIVRGYITGVTSTALWYRYSLGERSIYGYDFPEGLEKNQALPHAIITPTTKAGPGEHDERLTVAEVTEKGYLEAKRWQEVQEVALALFARGQERAQAAGLILVDTKYEFGVDENGNLILIDEVHTPDSSRYWRLDTYQEALKAERDPDCFDKEYVRKFYAENNFRGQGDAPKLPSAVWQEVGELYISAYERLTGETFIRGEYPCDSRIENNLKKGGYIND